MRDRVSAREPVHTAAYEESGQWQSGVTHEGRLGENSDGSCVELCKKGVCMKFDQEH